MPSATSPSTTRTDIGSLLTQGLTPDPHPTFSGAVFALDSATTEGRERLIVSAGLARQYADLAGTPLPTDEQVAIAEDTIFDIASLTKLFTASVIMSLVERDLLGLDEPLSRFFQEYDESGRDGVTVRHLLTHTSGLPPMVSVWRDGTAPADRPGAVLQTPLQVEPGTRFSYSCAGFITLGLLAEQLTGKTLDQLVQRLICEPLGLTETGYLPLERLGEGVRDRIAATECRDQSDHRGIVHDETAASLGGVAGNAGIFSTAADLLTFGRFFLDGTSDTGAPLPGAPLTGAPLTGAPLTGAPLTGAPLTGASVAEMFRPQLPDSVSNDYQSGLGFRIDDAAAMGALAGMGTAYGHTGFTGTSLVIDHSRGLVLSLLTNRVHPNRDWSELQTFRREASALVARPHLDRDGGQSG